ncbi:MAG: VWA domain-containing protein [Anaerolineae bacterium]
MCQIYRSLLLTTIVALGSALGLAASPAAADRPPPPATSDCVVRPRKSVSPDVLLLGETATVTLGFDVDCTVEEAPVHVVLVLDSSASIDSESLTQLQAAARHFIRGLLLPELPTARIGIVSFGHGARTLCPLTRDLAKLEICLKRLRPKGDSGTDRGLTQGLSLLMRARETTASRRNPYEIMVLIGNGRSDHGCRAVQAVTRRIQEAEVLRISVCIDDDCASSCMGKVASSRRDFIQAHQADRFVSMFQPGPYCPIYEVLRRLDLVDRLSPDVALVVDSAVPAAALSPDGRTLSWSFADLPREGVTVSYRIRPLATGTLSTSMQTTATFVDHRALPGTVDFPLSWLTVLAPAHRP